jgi:rod shape determining protein RodA
MLIGWVNIYAAVYDETHQSIFDFSQRYGKQLIWIISALFLATVILLLDSSFYTTFAYFIYGIVLLMLIVVLFTAGEVKGAKSWFTIGGFALQPSEFSKFATALALAKYLGNRTSQRLITLKDQLISATIIAIPALLILLQNDTGSTLVYTAFILVLYREGISGNILLLGFLTVIVFIVTLLFGPFLIGLMTIFLAIAFVTLAYYGFKEFIISEAVAALILWLTQYFTVPTHYLFYIITAVLITYFIIHLYNSKLKYKKEKRWITFIVLTILLFITSIDYVFYNVLKDHQRTRISVLLGEEDKIKSQIKDLQSRLDTISKTDADYEYYRKTLAEQKQSLKDLQKGALWNVKQSLIAIGSGGFSGKGFLKGTQTKYNFVPEQSTDFIFCTIGEEWGFLGTFTVIIIYITLFLRLIFLAERQRSTFSRIYGYSVASILFFHFFINIGMTIGLAPVIGIPLPFISYGGSSLWAFTILLFIFIKLDSERLFVLR